MKLEKILEKLNTIEKISFSKILYQIINEKPKNYREIDKILSNYSDRELKKLDNPIVAKVFSFVEEEYYKYLDSSINNSVSQLDILIDILIRDGNCIMSREWFGKLYDKEIKKLKQKIKLLKAILESEDSTALSRRDRDFYVYQACVNTAYHNDRINNFDSKITADEKSILNILASNLDLSHEEEKQLNYSILPLKILPLEELIDLLKTTGIILYSKKNLTLYIPDEFVRLLRRFRGVEVAEKYLKRILNLLKDPQLNLVCRRFGINRKQDRKGKIRAIAKEGVSLRGLIKTDIHKEGTKLSEKKKFLNTLVEKGLGITHLKGTTLDSKIDHLINFFNEVDKEEKVGISIDGYDKLLLNLDAVLPGMNSLLRNEFELQEEEVLNSNLLLDHNIKPRELLELIPGEKLNKFCVKFDISTRGNDVLNVLRAYKDSKNIELENYVSIATRDLELLKENGIRIKEADLGAKFEELTKELLISLGFNVDDGLRKKLNTAKDKIDILISLNDNEVILIECKTAKENGYNKFSSVKRQILAYQKLLDKNNFKVVKTLLIAPDFSDDFINECEVDYTINLSLIRAGSLLEINHAFKKSSKLQAFPPALFMKDVVIQEDRVIKAIIS